MTMIETYPGYVLPTDARVEQRHIGPQHRAIKVSKPGARRIEYAVFEEKHQQWRATGEVLSGTELNDRIRDALARSA